MRPSTTSTGDAAWIVAVATVVLAIANLLFLWLNARATRQFEERVQRTARNQARIEGVYRDFVTLMHRARLWADFRSSPELASKAPDPIADPEVSEMIAGVRTFGSDAVVVAADAWGDLFSEVLYELYHRRQSLQERIEALRAQEKVVRGLIREELLA